MLSLMLITMSGDHTYYGKEAKSKTFSLMIVCPGSDPKAPWTITGVDQED